MSKFMEPGAEPVGEVTPLVAPEGCGCTCTEDELIFSFPLRVRVPKEDELNAGMASWVEAASIMCVRKIERRETAQEGGGGGGGMGAGWVII